MLDKLLNRDDDKKDDKESQIQHTVQTLTDQIGKLRQELQAKNTQVEELQSQLKTAQTGAQTSASSASQQTQQLQQQNQQLQKQVEDLKRQLSASQSDDQSAASASQNAQKQIADLQTRLNEATSGQANRDKQIADLQAQIAAAASAAGVTAPAGAQAVATGATSLGVGGQAWVTREGGMGLRLRSGAGLEHNVLGSLPPGTQMTLLAGPQSADNYSWWQVRTADGREGWVAGQDLRPQAD